MANWWLVLLVVVGSAAWGEPPRADPSPDQADSTSCEADADCVAGPKDACCHGCCPEPRAWNKRSLAEAKKRCGGVGCPATPCLKDCGPVSAAPAVCKMNHCKLAERK